MQVLWNSRIFYAVAVLEHESDWVGAYCGGVGLAGEC